MWRSTECPLCGKPARSDSGRSRRRKPGITSDRLEPPGSVAIVYAISPRHSSSAKNGGCHGWPYACNCLNYKASPCRSPSPSLGLRATIIDFRKYMCCNSGTACNTSSRKPPRAFYDSTLLYEVRSRFSIPVRAGIQARAAVIRGPAMQAAALWRVSSARVRYT